MGKGPADDSEFWGDGRVLTNTRHENFALYMAEGMSKAESWRRAFGKPKEFKVRGGQPSQLMKRHPEIGYRVAQLRKQIANRAVEHAAVSHAFVLDRLKENVERCMQKEPVKNGRGEEVGEWKYNASGANKALELLGRSIGLFADKAKASELENANEHELRAELERLRSEIEAEASEGSSDSERTQSEEALAVSPLPEAG